MWSANAYILQNGTLTQIGSDRAAGGKNAKEKRANAVLFLQWLPKEAESGGTHSMLECVVVMIIKIWRRTDMRKAVPKWA